MEFSIIKGNPTPEELAALKTALAQHKREELKPVIRRSVYGFTTTTRSLAPSNYFRRSKEFINDAKNSFSFCIRVQTTLT